MVVSTVFAPLAPAVQAQGVPGTVRARSCAVGTDTLASIGVSGAGTIYVTDGSATKAIPYDASTSQTITSLITSIQAAMRASDPIDGNAVANFDTNGFALAGALTGQGEIYGNYSEGTPSVRTYPPFLGMMWLGTLPSPITVTDVIGTFAADAGLSSAFQTDLSTPSGQAIIGPEFALASDPWNYTNASTGNRDYTSSNSSPSNNFHRNGSWLNL